MSPTKDRRQDILEHASALLRTRGFNAFSHRDLAELSGVKSSSVHYHFPTKQDLGIALIQQYREELLVFFESVADSPVHERLRAFVAPFVETAETGQHWCLAGMLASDYDSLSEVLRSELNRFFSTVEQWLSQQALLLNPKLSSRQAIAQGQVAMAMLEGALLLARAQQDVQRMHNAIAMLHTCLSGHPDSA